MDVLGDFVARDRLDAAPVLDAAGTPPRTYGYRRLCANVWKTGNFLRHLGVREGTTVGVADEPVPESILAFFGSALLGATVRFDPPIEADCRAVVAPTRVVEAYDLPRGGKRVGYGPRPDDPAIRHFETGTWSENPTFPATNVVDGDDPALATPDRSLSHRTLLAAARRVVDEHGFREGTRVVVRAPFADPETVVAGVVAPLSVGATVVLPDGDSEAGDVAVARDDAPERVVVDPAAVVIGND